MASYKLIVGPLGVSSGFVTSTAQLITGIGYTGQYTSPRIPISQLYMGFKPCSTTPLYVYNMNYTQVVDGKMQATGPYAAEMMHGVYFFIRNPTVEQLNKLMPFYGPFPKEQCAGSQTGSHSSSSPGNNMTNYALYAVSFFLLYLAYRQTTVG